MCWQHRRFKDELHEAKQERREAGEQLAQVRRQGHSIRAFAAWVDRQLEENHFAERMLLGLELNSNPDQGSKRRRRWL